jgi:hypothetical protein
MNSHPAKRVFLETRDRSELILEALEPLLHLAEDVERIEENISEIKSNLRAIKLACYTN